MRKLKVRKNAMQTFWILFSLITILGGGGLFAAPQYSLTCITCHDMPPADGTRNYDTGAAVGNHQTHLASGAQASACYPCHNNTAYTNSHRDGKIQFSANIHNSVATGQYKVSGSAITFKNQTSIPVVGSCSNVNCHFETVTETWGVPAASTYSALGANTTTCAKCHAALPTTGSHTVHLTAYGNNLTTCANCHPNHAGAAKPFTHATSAGGPLKVIGGYTGSNNRYLPSQTGRVTGSCSTASCHDNGTGTPAATPIWGTAVNDCSECHAKRPTTGSHTPHLNSGAACAACHKGAVEGTTAPAQHLDTNVDVYASTSGDLGYPGDKAKGSAVASCTTAACHDDATGNLLETPTWGTVTTGCSTCHLGRPISGSHTAHMNMGATCGDCHSGAVENTSFPAQHVDGNIDVYKTTSGDLGYTANKAKASAYTSCSTASCHNNGVATQLPSAVWGTVVAQCTECHASRPSTGSHTAHLNTGAVCADCHKGAVEGSAPSVEHLDGNIDVYKTNSNDYNYGLNKAKNTAPSTCSTGSCHEDGRGNFVVSPTWGNSNNDCSACHAKQPATGSHTNHISAGITCGNCHKGAVEATTAPLQHIDGNIDVYKTNPGDLGYPADKTKGGAFTSCSASACHGTLSKTWGISTSNHQCTKCHGKGTPLANYSTASNRQAAPGYDVTGVGTGQQTGTVTNNVSSDPKVGAHDAHLRSLNNLGKPVVCSDCHAVPATAFTSGHMNGAVEMTWSKLAKNTETTPGSQIPYTFGSGAIIPGYVNGQCSSNYCHGATLPGGTDKSPKWNDSTYFTRAPGDCAKCHAAPPTSGSSKFNHAPTDTTCTNCHPHNGDRGTQDPLTGSDFHMNGKLEANKYCDTCHDYDTRGTNGTLWGKNSKAVEGFGAHAVHINYLKNRMGATALNPNVDEYGMGYAASVCGVCHSNLPVNHEKGNPGAPRNITFGESTARQFGPNPPQYNGITGVSSATTLKTCSNVDCHYKTSPIWQPY